MELSEENEDINITIEQDSEIQNENEAANGDVIEVHRLKRTLGLLDAAAIVVGIEIGSGIFASPGVVLTNTGDEPLVALLVWVLGGLVAMLGGLCVSELSAAWPTSGGPYVYFQLLPTWRFRGVSIPVGQLLAFGYTWSSFWVIKCGAQAIIAIVFGRYLGIAVGALDLNDPDIDARWSLKLIAASLIAVLTAINILGAQWAALVSRVTTIFKFLAILLLFFMGMMYFIFDDGASTLVTNLSMSPRSFLSPSLWISAMGSGVIASLWSYDGWADITNVAEEIKRPGRNMSRAILGGTGAVVVSYLLANVAYFVILTREEVLLDPAPALAASLRVGQNLAGGVVGSVAFSVMAALIALSALGACNGSTLSGARVLYAAGRDGMLPPLSGLLGIVGSRTGTPYISLLVQGLWGVVLVLPGNFESLISWFGVASFIFYFLTVAMMMALRHLKKDHARPFVVRPYPAVPLLFLFFSGLLILLSFVTMPLESLLAVVATFSGSLFYLAVVWEHAPVRWLAGRLGWPLRVPIPPSGMEGVTDDEADEDAVDRYFVQTPVLELDNLSPNLLVDEEGRFSDED